MISERDAAWAKLMAAPTADNGHLADTHPDRHQTAVTAELESRGAAPAAPTREHEVLRGQAYAGLFPQRAARERSTVDGILAQREIGEAMRARGEVPPALPTSRVERQNATVAGILGRPPRVRIGS